MTLVVVALVASEGISLEVNAGDDVVVPVAPPVDVPLEVNTDFVDVNTVVTASLLFALPVVGVGSDSYYKNSTHF